MANGVKLSNNKKISITDNVFEFSKPELIYIPLINHDTHLCESIVNIGDEVLKGSVVALRMDIDLPIHSSVSGKVLGYAEKTYYNGEKVNCIVIQNDFHEKQFNMTGARKNFKIFDKERFVNKLKECSVTGMGGSDFPTFLKYNGELNTLIVNAVECEPYVTVDFMLAKLKAEDILEAIDIIIEINKINKCIIAIKEGDNRFNKALKKYLGTYPNISLLTVRNVYPIGWERDLIFETLKIKYKDYPIEKGIVVNNISTIYAIYKALKYSKPISRRMVTITGDMIKKPQNVIVKIGTPISDVIKEIGGYKAGTSVKFIAGGPMMGVALPSDDLIVTKNLNCVLVLRDEKDNIPELCFRCGKCTEICPCNLSPVLIKDKVNNAKALKYMHPEKCIECGLCSYICPSKINVRDAVIKAKKELGGQ